MARLIAAVGTVSYGGVTFPSALHSTIQAKVNYQTGEVGRKYIDYAISIDTVLTYTDPPMSNLVTVDADVGTNFIDYRKKLTSPGKTLTFTEQGFGDIVINATAGAATPNGARLMKDVAFGPKPRLLLWEPLSNRAVHVAWKCDTSAVECSNDSITGATGILEITHESHWSKDQEGRVIRTVRATIEIAGNVVNQGNQFADTADAYVDRFKPLVIQGFHREVSRQISRDHRVLNITYTDTEIFSDNPFYPGLVSMSVSQNISSSLAGEGFTRWTNTLDGSVRYAAGVPVGIAWASIADLIVQRFAIGGVMAPEFNGDKTSKNTVYSPIPASLSLTNELFDRELSFSFTWHSILHLDNLIGTSGILKPLTKLSWANWHESIIPVQSPKGTLGLGEKVSDITLVQICNTGSEAGLPNNEIKKPAFKTSQPWFQFGCANIPKDGSWYQPGNYTVQPITNGSLTPAFPAVGPPDTAYTPATPFHTALSTGLNANSGQTTPSSSESPSFQSRTYPECRIIVTGEIVRVCYEPYSPLFTHYGDVKLIEVVKRDQIRKVNGQFFPIYYMTVYREFILERMPTEDSPKLKTDANANHQGI